MKAQLVSFVILIISFSNLNFQCQSLQSDSFEGLKNINGALIYFKIVGNGEPVLIVHGGPGLGHDYLFQPFSQLSDNFKLIFYDQRGSGLSDEIEPEDSVNMNTLVEDLEQTRKEFKIEKLNLAGQSWGALVCIEYTDKYPENVSKLLLLEPAPGSTEYLAEFQQTIMNRLSPSDKEMIIYLSQKPALRYDPVSFNQFMNLRFKGYSIDSTFTTKMHINYFDSLRVVKFFSSSANFSPYLMSFNLYKKMKSINCPTLIIHGEYDPVPLLSIERMANAIPSSELHIIRNCGHFVHIEKPKEYFNLISTFLNSNKKK